MFCIAASVHSQNSIKGKIDFAKSKFGFIEKGNSYSDSNNQTAEKIRIDEANSPERNIYISLHPTSFQAQVAPIQNVQITQRAKTFYPNVIVVTKGSTVHFVNEDEHYHNVYSLSSKSRFNIGRRPTGNVYGQKISKSGIIKLGCDIHPEMGAVIISLDTPYFTKAGENGDYEINDLPDGKYEIKIYHPSLQKYKEEISLKGGQIVEQNISLKPKV